MRRLWWRFQVWSQFGRWWEAGYRFNESELRRAEKRDPPPPGTKITLRRLDNS